MPTSSIRRIFGLPKSAKQLAKEESQKRLTALGQAAGTRVAPAAALELQTPEQRAALATEARGRFAPSRAAVTQRLRDLANLTFEGAAEQLGQRGINPRAGVFAQEFQRRLLPQVTQAQVQLEQGALGLGERLAGAQRGEFARRFGGGLTTRGQDIGQRGQDIGLFQERSAQAQDVAAAARERRRRRKGGVLGTLGTIAGGVGGFLLGGPAGAATGAGLGGRLGSSAAEAFA